MKMDDVAVSTSGQLSPSEMRKIELEMELMLAKEALKVRRRFLQDLDSKRT
jgi:hypothetical protein